MKWLILVLIVSCGQKNPPAKDVGDSDGDQILNYLEESAELEKFTANIKPFSEVKATLSFRQGNQVVSVELSNESNLHRISYNLLTKRQDLIKMEDHFSEWSQLRVISTDALNEFPYKNYDMTLKFHNTSEVPDHLELRGVKLSDYMPVIKFNLSGNDLSELLKGKIFFSLKRAEMQKPHSESSTVRQRTYRVFWNDGNITQVYYVSNELSFKRFLELKNIIKPNRIEDKYGLGWTDENKEWWVRNLGEKDKVLIKASEKDISVEMEKNFIKGSQEVQRINGQTVKTVSVTKTQGARLFLKLRGKKEFVSFPERTRTSRRGGGHQEPLQRCTHWIRDISSNGENDITSEEILNTVQIQTENKAFSVSDMRNMAYEAFDEEGPYLEILFDTSDLNIRITMPNRPESTYTKTGEYKWYCSGEGDLYSPGVRTNDEGHFTTRVDTYVEKLED